MIRGRRRVGRFDVFGKAVAMQGHNATWWFSERFFCGPDGLGSIQVPSTELLFPTQTRPNKATGRQSQPRWQVPPSYFHPVQLPVTCRLLGCTGRLQWSSCRFCGHHIRLLCGRTMGRHSLWFCCSLDSDWIKYIGFET